MPGTTQLASAQVGELEWTRPQIAVQIENLRAMITSVRAIRPRRLDQVRHYERLAACNPRWEPIAQRRRAQLLQVYRLLNRTTAELHAWYALDGALGCLELAWMHATGDQDSLAQIARCVERVARRAEILEDLLERTRR